MKPSQLSYHLRRIASAIDNSKNPSRSLVARDLNDLIYRISSNKAKATKMCSDIDEIAHKILLSRLPRSDQNLQYYLGQAENVWGENTKGWDVVKEYIITTFKGFSGDPAQEHAGRLRAIKAVNAWRSLKSEVKNSEFETPITEPNFPIEEYKRSILVEAFEAMKADKRMRMDDRNKLYKHPISDLRYLNVPHGEPADHILKMLGIDYNFPPDLQESDKTQVVSDLADIFFNEIRGQQEPPEEDEFGLGGYKF